ncbi:MAG TPA: protein-disulfide reductase DsbD domain-containing protein [Methyloceanibacter sp.]|nr:protein-disulfide reductase DsbD domain-containing protein [Methyloceanibacter sp.]
MNRIVCSAQRATLLLTALAVATISGIAFGGAGLAASKGESAWSGQTNSRVRLVSGTIARDGVSALYAGVQLRMEPDWKTYWQNPGDSGVPPTFDWAGSKNLKSAEVLYPVPHRFADANGTAIGYHDEVVFPVKIVPERPGEPVELSLNFEYGLCKDLCIPNAVELSATLPADLGKGDARLIEMTLARVPKPAQADGLPRIAKVVQQLDGETPGLEVEALFPEGATGTDLFIASPEVLVPVPKALGPLQDGKQRFVVAFLAPAEAAAIKGKPLTLTLISNQGSTDTTWTAK